MFLNKEEELMRLMVLLASSPTALNLNIPVNESLSNISIPEKVTYSAELQNRRLFYNLI
jgi:hypothetical protein